MNGVLYGDDRQVDDLHVIRRRDGAEGARVTVSTMGIEGKKDA